MRHATAVLLWFALALPLTAETIVPIGAPTGRWSRPTLTLLHDGRVLVVGDESSTAIDIFNPSTATFTRSTAATHLPLVGHTATLLADGRVLIAGGGYRTDGRPGFGNFGDDVVEIYDPTCDLITRVGSMSAARMLHTATLLHDGRVLITGGEVENIGGFHVYRLPTETADVFDPATNTVQPVASMHSRRSEHTATLLPDGRVFVLGTPRDFYGDASGAAAEIFDPATSTFSEIAAMPQSTRHQAFLLPNGLVAVVGPQGKFVIDVDASTWRSSTAGFGFAFDSAAGTLRDGRVLVLAGTRAITWDAESDRIVRDTETSVDFSHVALAVLESDRVLIVGNAAYLLLPGDRMRRRSAR